MIAVSIASSSSSSSWLFRIVVIVLVSSFLLVVWTPPVVDATAAGTETLIGICGDGFVLIAADAVARSGGGATFTSTDLDKIAVLTPLSTFSSSLLDAPILLEEEEEEGTDAGRSAITTTPPIVVAAAGDAADADRLVGMLRAEYNIDQYETNGDMDVAYVDFSRGNTETLKDTTTHRQSTLTVHSIAQMARYTIAYQIRTRNPCNVCLLIAGLIPGVVVDKQMSSNMEFTSEQRRPTANGRRVPSSLAETVQKQVQTAKVAFTNRAKESSASTVDVGTKQDPNGATASHPLLSSDVYKSLTRPLRPTPAYKPVLYWLDEYGAIQRVPYGVHGMASDMIWSILDRGYHPQMTLPDALALLRECLSQLQTRYLINTQPQFCIKCVDSTGCRIVDLSSTSSSSTPLSSKFSPLDNLTIPK